MNDDGARFAQQSVYACACRFSGVEFTAHAVGGDADNTRHVKVEFGFVARFGGHRCSVRVKKPSPAGIKPQALRDTGKHRQKPQQGGAFKHDGGIVAPPA